MNSACCHCSVDTITVFLFGLRVLRASQQILYYLFISLASRRLARKLLAIFSVLFGKLTHISFNLKVAFVAILLGFSNYFVIVYPECHPPRPNSPVLEWIHFHAKAF